MPRSRSPSGPGTRRRSCTRAAGGSPGPSAATTVASSNDGAGGRNLDARSTFFYLATVNTPAMVMKMIGRGSQYGILNQDSTGQVLDGSRNYRLTVPADVPAKDFWSVVVYDPQTRSELQTGQPYPSMNNRGDRLVANPDGSVDLSFGPTGPDAKQDNWIQTVPAQGWFLILRRRGAAGGSERWFADHSRAEPVKPGARTRVSSAQLGVDPYVR